MDRQAPLAALAGREVRGRLLRGRCRREVRRDRGLRGGRAVPGGRRVELRARDLELAARGPEAVVVVEAVGVGTAPRAGGAARRGRGEGARLVDTGQLAA